MNAEKNWIDISVPVRNGMVHWPGDPAFKIDRALDQAKGDTATVSHIDLGVHTGTHMDAPLHFIQGGATIDQIPFTAVVGPARVIPIADRVSIKPEELVPHALLRGERVLFKTFNSEYAWDTEQFVEDFVYISREAARYLAEIGIQTVGVDYLSVGGFHTDGAETHQALLGAGIWIIEGLNLRNIEPATYDLVCLPLKLMGAEGAPARAILRSID